MFRDILTLANKHLFFSPLFSGNSKNILSFCFGPAGSLFRENIKGEWIYSNVTNRDINVFMYNKQNLENTDCENQLFLNARDMCNHQMPFGIANIYEKIICEKDNTDIAESSCFSSLNSTHLVTKIFIMPSDGMHYFFHWQRQRKLWWKKVSASPSRFFLGEIHKSSNKKIVNILANFPWGNEILETISIYELDGINIDDLKPDISCKSVSPLVIKNEMSLDAATVGLFCDALDVDSVHNTPVLRIHRKLTPYKCIFATSALDSSALAELSQLAFYLTKQFRKAGISTLLLPDSTIPLLMQFQRNDQWGIPFTIVLDSTSLKSGVTNIRSRDTTLKEEVHVSELTPYILNLIKNF